jgi:predicted transcriptional regulator
MDDRLFFKALRDSLAEALADVRAGKLLTTREVKNQHDFETVADKLRAGLADMRAGRTEPLEKLWEGIEVEDD